MYANECEVLWNNSMSLQYLFAIVENCTVILRGK
jgi:hypothetical protein